MTTVKADITAADRLLKAAVRKAADMIRSGHSSVGEDGHGCPVYRWRPHDRNEVVAVLTAAGEGAALLYGEAS